MLLWENAKMAAPVIYFLHIFYGLAFHRGAK
jgi:hypothetical protein